MTIQVRRSRQRFSGVVDGEVIISLPTTPDDTSESIGKPYTITVWAYSYDSLFAPGWKRLLYDGLHDFAERRNLLAIFKLATSVELYADLVFEKYLIKKSISPRLSNRLRGSARTWPARAARVADLALSLLTDQEAKQYEVARPGYKKLVREPRNLFAHGHTEEVTEEATSNAYGAAFDILWTINKIEKAVGPVIMP